ncbi:NACHT nucleoside triphosphatase [Penicillium capsulatum]|uniref:NACHT nucleoside triphosphatase n=1 Tax=Penicillium capsulatum TaxID=69766 RepID=A0A9W9I9M6_9EURO|nr:NACHT nucleoside triphosphatase [Penicillium capsulatum]KAJ6136656.1 NACHT nucleoside triphosphatase [Penicillium capsulatum]
MADPLAIASGIAGLLSLGIQATQSLVNFYTTYKGQDTDLAKVAQNLDNLLGIFRALDIAVEERRSRVDTQDLLREVEKAVQKCEEIITELQSECQNFSKDTAAGLKDRVKTAGRCAAYPFRKSTLQKLEEDVSDMRENISVALDILQLKSQTQIQDDISEVKSLVERTNASQVSFTIRCWLMAPDAALNHNATCAKCHPSTGLWFVRGHQFRTWLEERNSFLWLNGFAGCGKSVLCSTAIQHMFRETRHKHSVGIAFFYFSFNDNAKQDDNGMLRALLLQLSVQLQGGERDLEQLHALYKSASPPVHALLDIVRRFLERFCDTYILLDAFRYVECQFNALRRVKNIDQLDKCLRTLPRDLDETYERILCSIDDDYFEDVRLVLAVLCISTRPLTVNKLIDAHTVDLSEPPRLRRDGRSYAQDDLIDICLGLIEIVATEDNNGRKILTARIAHFSVQEYLQSDRILQ